MIDVKESMWLQSSLYGLARASAVEVIVYPLEVVKLRQQCSLGAEGSLQIARHVLGKEGASAFYRGFVPQLLKSGQKQIWCWPMMVNVPIHLQSHGIKDPYRQILTALSISTLDAAISTPLERTKILSAVTKGVRFSILGAYKDGLRGFTAYWTKRSVSWVTFFTAQKILRERASARSKEPLSPSQLAWIGVQVALIVSVASAPFDYANTQKQANNQNLSSLLSRKTIAVWFRGAHLNFLSLVIHNIASVSLLAHLDKD
jgi:hypothetical protein